MKLGTVFAFDAVSEIITLTIKAGDRWKYDPFI